VNQVGDEEFFDERRGGFPVFIYKETGAGLEIDKKHYPFKLSADHIRGAGRRGKPDL